MAGLHARGAVDDTQRHLPFNGLSLTEMSGKNGAPPLVRTANAAYINEWTYKSPVSSAS